MTRFTVTCLALFTVLFGSPTTAMSTNALPLIPAPADTRILATAGMRGRTGVFTDALNAASFEFMVEIADAPAPGAVFIGPLAGADPEAYTLDILEGGVVLRAGGPDGVTWGLQTLRQLLPAAIESPLPVLADDPGRPDGRLRPLPEDCRYPRNNLRPVPEAPQPEAIEKGAVVWTVPCLRITDQPRFGWRGVLLDCARHYMDIPAIERVLDLMSLHKLNRLHWHLTEDQGWRLEIKSRPLLTELAAWRTDQDGVRYGGFYTQDEARHIVEYAAERGITVIPEIEMPGHSQAVLAAYPQLGCRGVGLDVQSCWGVWPDVFCAGNDDVFIFLEDVLTEVLDIFPSEFIHVGGDECPKDRWQECPRCQARIANEGLADEHELQSWFIQRMERWLAERGRRLIGWDEILEGGLAPGATVQSWRGFEGAISAASQGHDTVVSPTGHAYFDFDIGVTDLAKVLAFEPVPAELTAEQAQHVLGGEMNLWTEYAPQAVLDERLFPRLCAMSEVLWSPAPAGDEHDLTGFWARLRSHGTRLDRLGVRRAYEGRPVTLAASWDPQQDGWLLAWSADSRRPAGDPTVELAAGGNRRKEPVESTVLRRDAGVVSATLHIDDTAYGAPQRLELVRSHALGRSVTSDPEPAVRYAPRVENPVTDGVLPDGDYHDGRWLAWEGPDATVVVDLGAAQNVSDVSAICLHAGGRLIYSPESVRADVSLDGSTWREIGAARWRLEPGVMARVLRTYRITTADPCNARYVRLHLEQRRDVPIWPWAPDSAPWMFLGQLVIR